MKTEIDGNLSELKKKLTLIKNSLHVTKEWLEMISRAKISESDKKTCKRIIKCLATSKKALEEITKEISK